MAAHEHRFGRLAFEGRPEVPRFIAMRFHAGNRGEFVGEKFPRRRPHRCEGDALRPVGVARERAKFFELGDGT